MSCSYPFIQPNYGSNSGGGGSGTVTSVALSMPAIFSVSGSPVTTTGTLTATLATQTAGKIFAAPPTTTGTPTFQTIVAEHLNPTYSNGQVLTTNGAGVVSWTTVGGSGTVTSVGLSLPSEITVTGSPVTGAGTLTGTWTNQTAGKIFAAPPTSTGTPTFLQIQAEHLNATYTNTYILQTNGTGVLSWVVKPTGTVTSVGLTMPSEFQIANSPVTSSGTIAVTWGASVPAGRILAAPPTAIGAPSLIQIQAEHLNATYTNTYILQTNGTGVLSWVAKPTGTVTSVGLSLPSELTVTNSPVTTTGTLTGTWATQTAGKIFAAPPTSTGTPTFLQVQAEHLSGTFSNGQYLTTNGSGVLSWATVSSSSPGGSNTNIQFNNSSSFGGSSDFVWNNTTKQLSLTQTITSAAASSSLFIGRTNSTATSNSALVVSGTFENATTGLLQLQTTGGLYSNFFANGKIILRSSSGSNNPTNGIVEIPWISGDTVPTVYIGHTSSTMAGLRVVNSGSGSYAESAIYASSDGYAVTGISNNYTGGYFLGGGCGVRAESTGYATAAYFKQTYGSSGLNAHMIEVHTNAVTGTTYNILHIFDGTYKFLTTTTTGKTSVRSGLATDNKMTDVGGVYYTSTTNVGNVGTGEDDLSNVTIGANLLGTDNDRVEIEGSFTIANNADAKTIKLYFGSLSLTFDATTDQSGKIVARATVIRISSTTQDVYATFNETNSSGNTYVTTGSETLSSSVIIKFTGQGTTTNDIVQNTFTVKYYPKGGA